MYRRLVRAASCGMVDSVAEIGLSGASCYIVVSNSIPVLVPPLQDNLSFGNCRSATREIGLDVTGPALEVALCQSGLRGGENVRRSPESRPVSRSVGVLALRWRPGRSPGPGLLRTQVGAGNHPGQDAKPTRHRLSLLGGVRRRPAIGRWSPRQLVHLSAVCRDSSGRCSRKRVCTIATRNKTSHGAAHVCDPLQALFFSAPFMQYWGCTGG